jgi:hypothetical protein
MALKVILIFKRIWHIRTGGHVILNEMRIELINCGFFKAEICGRISLSWLK